MPRFYSVSGMFAEAGIDDFDAIMRKKANSLIRRLGGSTNRVLEIIADRYEGLIQKYCMELLKNVNP